MKHWIAPSGASKGRARRPALWPRQESTNITKNRACAGRRNLRLPENGVFVKPALRRKIQKKPIIGKQMPGFKARHCLFLRGVWFLLKMVLQ
jgi:hypothetical protein